MILSVLRNSADGTIYDDRDKQFLESEITLIDRQQPTMASIISAPASSWTALSARVPESRPELKQIQSLTSAEVEAFSAALEPLVNSKCFI